MNRFLLLLATASLIAGYARADDPPLTGHLCMVGTKTSQCRDTSGAALLLGKDETAGKLFVWTRSDEQVVIAGVIPKTESIDVNVLTAGTVGLPLVLKAAKSVSVRPPLAFTLTSREKIWQWEMTSSIVNRKAPVVLRLVPAEYSVTIAASKLLPLTSGKFEVRSSTHDLAAREFHFRDLPVVSGIVRSAASHTPLPDVRVASGGVLLAITGADGRFHYAAEKSGDATLEFSRTGYATHFASIVVPPDSTELEPVLLDKGATIRVEVKSDDPLDGALSADLFRIASNHLEKIRSTQVTRFAIFERVESGDYVIVLNGSAPLQHLATKINVDSGASLVEGAAVVTPLVLSGSVHLGDSPLSDAQITITDASYRVWSGLVRPQPDGTFSETVWDRSFRASIASAQLDQPYLTGKTIRSSFDTFWDIIIPTGHIVGRLHDKDSDQPIAGAMVRYSYKSGGTVMRNRGVDIREDGTFTISGVGTGEYIIDGTAVGYRPESLRVSISESSPNATVDVPLAKADGITLQVAQFDGEPVHDGWILIVDANNYVSLGLAAPIVRTDGFGEAHITRPAAGTRLFVLSPAGPWTEFTIPPDSDPSTPVRVALPRCDVRLHIRAVDVGGRPISGATFFVRYNGTVVPLQVWSFLSDLRMASAITGPSGETMFAQMPAGTYELVPFVNPSELRKAAMQKKWPVEASLAGGDAELTLVFEKAD